MSRKKRGSRKVLVSGLWLPLIILIIALLFFTALSNISSGQDEKALEQLEDVLRKTAVSCYAAEGFYPPTLEYMEEHYGIQIDRQRYTVHYQVFATNIMPDITVLEKSDEEK